MGSKHSQWFEYERYIAIHEKVIMIYRFLIKSGDTQYRIEKIQEVGGRLKELQFKIKFLTTNGFKVSITKSADVSPDQTKVITSSFSYNCQKQDDQFRLRYDSAHSETYNPQAPWHNHPHRHEIIGNSSKIGIYYDNDRRPELDKSQKYTWEGKKVEIELLGEDDWPHISEFLSEVGDLS